MGYVVVHKYAEQDLRDLKANEHADCEYCAMSRRTRGLDRDDDCLLCEAALYDTETLACFIPKKESRVRMPQLVAMICQPMNGRTEEEILKERDEAKHLLKQKGFRVRNTYFTGEWSRNEENGCEPKSPLWFLAKSLEVMAECNAVYFCKGWERARGCRIEHAAAVAYGLDIIYGP